MNPNYCFKCHHTRLAHDMKGDTGDCVVGNCGCVGFFPIPEYLCCGNCNHVHKNHGATGRCIVTDCDCMDYILPQKVTNQNLKIPPLLLWRKVATRLGEYDVPELNVKFHLITLNSGLDLRIKSYDVGHFMDWKKVSSINEANALVYNYLIARVKDTAKAIGLLEFKGTYPHLNWRQLPNFRDPCHRLALPMFGAVYWVNERTDGLALTREMEGTARTLLLPICKQESDVDRLVFNDIKSSLRRTIKRLGLFDAKRVESQIEASKKRPNTSDGSSRGDLFSPP